MWSIGKPRSRKVSTVLILGDKSNLGPSPATTPTRASGGVKNLITDRETAERISSIFSADDSDLIDPHETLAPERSTEDDVADGVMNIDIGEPGSY